jgi:hypothetical protein
MPVMTFFITFFLAATFAISMYLEHTAAMESAKAKILEIKQIDYASKRYQLERFSTDRNASVGTTGLSLFQKVYHTRSLPDMERFERAVDELVIVHGIESPTCLDFNATSIMTDAECLNIADDNASAYEIQRAGVLYSNNQGITTVDTIYESLSPLYHMSVKNRIGLAKKITERKRDNVSRYDSETDLNRFIQSDKESLPGYMRDEINAMMRVKLASINPLAVNAQLDQSTIERAKDTQIQSAINTVLANVVDTYPKNWTNVVHKERLWNDFLDDLNACKVELCNDLTCTGLPLDPFSTCRLNAMINNENILRPAALSERNIVEDFE